MFVDFRSWPNGAGCITPIPPPVAEPDVEAASGKNFRKLQRPVAERLTEGERPSAARKPSVNGPAAEVWSASPVEVMTTK